MARSSTLDGLTLVAGGATGLGADIARRIAELGGDIAVLDASPTPPATVGYPLATAADLERITAELATLGARTIGVRADVRSRTQVDDAVRAVEDALGPVRRLVVASGLFVRKAAVDLTDADWDEVVDTNLHGLYHLSRRILPGMTSRGEGRVVAIVGDEGRRGVAGQSHLAAASWAVIGLAKSIALEVAAAGVAVNVVCAGPTPTPATESAAFTGQFDGDATAALAAKHPNGQAWVAASDVVDAVTFLLAAPGTAMTGSVLDVSNGMSALNTA